MREHQLLTLNNSWHSHVGVDTSLVEHVAAQQERVLVVDHQRHGRRHRSDHLAGQNPVEWLHVGRAEQRKQREHLTETKKERREEGRTRGLSDKLKGTAGRYM